MKKLQTTGLRHLALWVQNFDATVDFYTRLLGMAVEWHPDADNIYLTSGQDNLALHRAPVEFQRAPHQALDHLGFIINTIDEVNAWHDFLVKEGVVIKAAPRTHRDGAHSFYCCDPDGNSVQMLYHPPLAKAGDK